MLKASLAARSRSSSSVPCTRGARVSRVIMVRRVTRVARGTRVTWWTSP